MLADTYRISISAQPDTIWNLLPEWLDNLDLYIHKVDSMKVVERSANRIVRELSYRGTPFRETAIFDQNSRSIRHELQDHPLYQGVYGTSVVPTSVQNPMAPVELQLYLELERRSFKIEKLVQMEGELATDIEKVLRILKRMAEEREHELEGRGQHLSEGVTHR
ncbi:hypothetical protein [Geotalea sp. SG265]|uniref:hypothetical protein n=1 Tax=Geotalea sp. SG265 TaxID=2922867 RepID=UPI001FAE9F21|nr:hypothetical protein [Geotalea sp. SG265]